MLPDDPDHIQPHEDGIFGVIRNGVRQSTHAVIAIPEHLYPQALVFLRRTVWRNVYTWTFPCKTLLTSASSSNRPKSSFRAVTKSEGSRAVVRGVKLTISANRILKPRRGNAVRVTVHLECASPLTWHRYAFQLGARGRLSSDQWHRLPLVFC